MRVNSASVNRPVGDGRTRSPGPSPPPSRSPLDKPIQYLRGVGPRRARLLEGLGVRTVGDLIEYFPFRFEHQTRPQAIDTLILDEPATIIGVIESVRCQGQFQNSRIQAVVSDGTGSLYVTWFNMSYLRDRLERGQVLRLFGSVSSYRDHGQMINPRLEWLDAEADPASWDYERMTPVYRATAGLTSLQIARLTEAALAEALPVVQESLPKTLLDRRKLPGRRAAVECMHRPRDERQWQAARERLAFEELLHMQLAVALQRIWVAAHARSVALPSSLEIDRRIRRRFPFKLTAAQDRVIKQITADLARERSMNRLLQGDVGSGKTVVALYAALVSVARRTQCAILAPTEVLAAQHFAGIERYLVGSRVNRCLLTGQTPKSRRDRLLADIAGGSMHLVVGTQALLERKVRFHSLGLLVVDEQHKFGVAQRAALRASRTRGPQPQQVVIPHYLVMTATPIPRTLSMTVFGDLDVSIIDELPPGRQPVETRIVRPAEEGRAWAEARRRVAAGQQVYVVYPLVEESDSLDLRAATVEVQRVERELMPGARVGLLHGRMKKDEKRKVMADFTAGRLDVLVSTTVIEVGVDVPNATVMIVQHAERYGLSALHQLRGRVGRGRESSICLLMTESRGETANKRLRILCESNDGFRIAEEDLRLRGPGELLGTRQHGWPEFRVANPVEDVDLLMQARDEAARIVREDPGLRRPEHVPLLAELRRRFRDKVAFLDVG